MAPMGTSSSYAHLKFQAQIPSLITLGFWLQWAPSNFFKLGARIRSLPFVSGSLASRPDSISSFCFGFSGIMLGFDPFLLFRVFRHRTLIRSLPFVSGSQASRPDSIPSFCFRFSNIVLGFDPFLFRVLGHCALIRSVLYILGSPELRPN